MKITSADVLEDIRRKAVQELAVREESNKAAQETACGLEKGTPHMQILCCGGTGCKASQSKGEKV